VLLRTLYQSTMAQFGELRAILARFTAADYFAALSALHWTAFGFLLMINPSGSDKSGLFFHPGTPLPLWQDWNPMVVMVGRTTGTCMIGAFGFGWLLVPRATFVKQAAILNACYLGFFISAAFDSTAVTSTFRMLVWPVALLTLLGCFVVFSGTAPAYTPLLGDRIEEGLVKSSRFTKSFGLNSWTSINAILLFWGTLAFFFVTDMNLLTPAGPLPIPMFLIVFNGAALWFAKMWSFGFFVVAFAGYLFDVPAPILAKQLLGFFTLYYIDFTWACIEHTRFDLFIAIFSLPVGGIYALHIKTVYDDYKIGGLPLL